MSDQLHLFALPPDRSDDPCCEDCGLDTIEAGEYYMVRDDVWPLDTAGGMLLDAGGMLCIGCLEGRIGRRLTPADFTAAPINWDFHRRSRRLLSRLGGAA